VSLPDAFGIVANCSDGWKGRIRPGALGWLTMMNGDMERWAFLVHSRSGRVIEHFLPLVLMLDWRVKFVPPKYRHRAQCYDTREQAQGVLDKWKPWEVAAP